MGIDHRRRRDWFRYRLLARTHRAGDACRSCPGGGHHSAVGKHFNGLARFLLHDRKTTRRATRRLIGSGPGVFPSGASRTRTGDLLGAIQNQRFPDSPTVFTDQSCLQGFLSPERDRLSRLSTHLRTWRGCIWVARPVVAVSNESARMVRLELRSWRRKGSKLSALRRQTVEGRCPLGCPRRRQCPEPHAASPRPRRSGRCFEARRGRGRGGAVVVARPTELVERRIRRDSRPRYAAKPNRLRPCHRVCSRGSSSRLPSRRAGSRRCSNRRSGGSGPSGCRWTRSLPRERSSTSARRPWHRGSRRCAARRTPPRSPSLGVRELSPDFGPLLDDADTTPPAPLRRRDLLLR